MFVDFRGTIFGIIQWQWKSVLLFTVLTTVVVLAEYLFPDALAQVMLPAVPVAVVGGAIGIFVSFRTNSAYDRWWEGRKLWGRLINSSRHWCTQVLGYLPGDPDGADQVPPAPSDLQRRLVRRHIAYVHALRVLLRGQSLAEDAEFRQFLTEREASRIVAESNPTHALLQLQMQDIVAENDAGRLNDFRLTSMDETIRALLDIQGGCERIKKTPFPRSYGFIAERLIYAFGIMMPLGLVGTVDNDWVIVPLTVVVCLAFSLISESGRVLENPFTMFWPALPLSAMSKTIEINLRQRLGETDLPAAPKPDDRGVLM